PDDGVRRHVEGSILTVTFDRDGAFLYVHGLDGTEDARTTRSDAQHRLLIHLQVEGDVGPRRYSLELALFEVDRDLGIHRHGVGLLVDGDRALHEVYRAGNPVDLRPFRAEAAHRQLIHEQVQVDGGAGRNAGQL